MKKIQAKKTMRKNGLTRRQFVDATVAGAALMARLPRNLSASSLLEGPEVISTRGAVASEPAEVARVGARILERGGNAMDAAAAACLAGCMIQPHLSDLGGYVTAAVILDAKSNRVWSIDGNSVAPAAAHEKMFTVLPIGDGPRDINELEYGCRVKNDDNLYGPLAVAVPGTIGGIGSLWQRWGSLKWHEIVAPSQKLLEDGFPFGWTADAIKLKEPAIRKFDASVRHLMPDGKLPDARDVWHRPDMEKTLKRLVSAGWRDFYDGEIGRKIADFVASTGGILTRKDMAAFEPRITEPFAVTYRNARVCGAILSNGGLSSLQILNMLEGFEPVPDDSVTYWHRLAEIQKLVWRDRLLHLGDPEFANVPVSKLLSKDYAAGRVETIRQFPNHVDRLVPPLPVASPQGTLHLSAADANGNLVAITITHGGFFGSCLTVPGTGITLGHGMCRFDPRPGLVNSTGPRKRPLNNVSPTIVQMQDRDIALGSRGGRRIVNASAQLAQRIIDFKATGFQAAAAPRIHVQAKEPGDIANSISPAILKQLVEMGHELNPITDLIVGAHCAEFLKKERKVRASGNVHAAAPSP